MRDEERSRRDRWFGVGVAAAAALLTLWFYRDFIFHSGRMLFGTDMLGEGYQLREFALREVHAGRGIPGWNPFLYGGLPFVATLPGPLFYPSSLLYVWLPLGRAIGWSFVLHTFLAGVLSYWAARAFRASRAGAAVCGVAFMFTGYQASMLYGGHDGRMFAMVLIPLAFGFLERGLRSDKPVWFGGLAVTAALQLLTPHAQLMYFSSLSLSLYLIYRLFVPHAGAERGWAARGRLVAWFALAFVAAGLLSAAQLLPTIGLLDHAVRAAGERGYEFAASWALPPQELSALVLPDLIGSMRTYWGTNAFKLHTEYLGVVPVVLAVLALAGSLSGDGKERSRTVWFLAGGSVLGIAFALGGATPVHRMAYAVIPMIGRFRAPVMMLAPVAFFVALMAGLGWDWASESGSGAPQPRMRHTGRGRVEPADGTAWSRWAWVGLLAAPFLAVGLAAAFNPAGLQNFAYRAWYPAGWPRHPAPESTAALRLGGVLLLASWLAVTVVAAAVRRNRVGEWAVVALLLFTVGDLWRVDARYMQTVRIADAFQPDAVTERISSELAPGQRVWPVERTYQANDLMHFGIPSVGGSQKFLLEEYSRLVGGLSATNLVRYPALWKLFDLRFIISHTELTTRLLRPLLKEGDIRAYAVEEPAPHAFFPARVAAVASPEEALERTLAIDNPRARVVVEAEEAPPAGAGSADLVSYHPDEVILEAHARLPGLLFVSEVWAPGWRVFLDGRERRLYRTAVAFRGVHVPLGDHEVRFVYSPAYYRAGVSLSLGTLALGVLLGIGAFVRRRTRTNP